MEWCYDGLGGKIIDWTMKNGSVKGDGQPQDHPSLLALVVGRDGKVFSLLGNGQQYQAGTLAKWAVEQADKYEKEHPSTRLPFLRSKVSVSGEGSDEKATCEALDEARTAKRPVMMYFGRNHFEPDDKEGKKENKLARAVEKGTLNSKAAEKESAGWTLLRFDLSDDEHVVFARGLGVLSAPAFLMWLPEAEKPEELDRKISGPGLATLLKKHAPAQ